MPNGRLEARYTVPTGGWAVSATNNAGGPTTITIAAGTYYATALVTAFQTALNAGMGAPDFAVSVANTDGGTGKVTISVPSGVFSITWTSTDLRDALGFTATITGDTTETGTSSLKGLWLPDSPLVLPTDDTVGAYVSDLRQSVSPTGAVLSLVGNTFRQWTDCKWTHVSKDRALGTTTTPMNWEQFVYECFLGGKSYLVGGTRVALYSNATASTLIGYYEVVGVGSSMCAQAVQGWAGKWGVTIPRLINQAT